MQIQHFGNDGRVKARRSPGKEFLPHSLASQVQQGGGGIMVWASIFHGKRGTIHMVDDKVMNSDYYVNLLVSMHDWFIMESALLDNGPLLFQEDNCGIHKAEYLTWWKDTHDIDTTDHPPRSPDMNPIENVWGLII